MSRWVRSLFLGITLASHVAGAHSAGAGARPGADGTEPCAGVEAVFRKMAKAREHEPTFDIDSDYEFLRGQQRNQQLGKVSSFYSRRWQTRVYHTATGRPGADGRIPLVDPDSRAVFIFNHGSGTGRSGGKNFIHKMNDLAGMNYSAIAVDMPFHADGRNELSLMNARHYMNWLDAIVSEAAAAGKPVYLVGHSFGPTVVAEYLSRFKGKVQGALLASPPDYNDHLAKWFRENTLKMNIKMKDGRNRAGGAWSARVSEGFRWKDGDPAYDPALGNESTMIRVLTGDREEFVDAPVAGRRRRITGPNTFDLCADLRRRIRGVICVREEGMGHYIFQHRDDEGNDVYTRELLALDHRRPVDVAELTREAKAVTRAPGDLLAIRYNRDRLFAGWFDRRFGDAALARLRSPEREALAAEETDPGFFAKHEDWIADLEKPGKLNVAETSLAAAYLEHLERLPAAERPARSRVTEKDLDAAFDAAMSEIRTERRARELKERR